MFYRQTFPGDLLWPNRIVWRVLDLLTGGDTLIRTVPLSAPCYNDWGVYDEDRCAFITEQFTNSSLQYVPHATGLLVEEGPTTDSII